MEQSESFRDVQSASTEAQSVPRKAALGTTSLGFKMPGVHLKTLRCFIPVQRGCLAA